MPKSAPARCPHCAREITRVPDETESLLFAHRSIDIATGCWLWTGTRDGLYGTLYVAGAGRKLVHRLSAALWLGLDLADSHAWVCHQCENKLCFNPTHLQVGSVVENNRDRWERAGHRHPNNSFVKLTEMQVNQIREALALGCLQGMVADAFGITQGYVSAIKRNAAWRIVA